MGVYYDYGYGYECNGSLGSGFALIVVLFILLIIVGTVFYWIPN
ncbi:sporulation protein YjcZ [Bacillus pseudomycoides]|nr:YjcZ family sporulation protein [Bacillus pseudomycoides]PEA83854.1 sporulation protein YjcZ [Bacillus pseudomycoides]PFZ13370.1 sporulation protein YjcZ [Bacillus pseudomycoides]